MKWFKHDSNAHRDAKLKKLMMNYGLEGYGLYWHCLEEIANTVSQDKYTFELEQDAEIIAFDTGVSIKKVEEIMKYMISLNLFENDNGVITCLKMAKRLDSSMTSNQEMRNIISRTKKNHDPVMTKSIADKNRREENRKEDSRGKNGKRFIPPSIQEIEKYCREKNKSVDAEQFWNFYESKGWYVGKNKMKSWHSAVGLWHSRNKPKECEEVRDWV